MRKRCGQADRIWVSSRQLKGRMDALVAVAPSSPLRQCWLVERYGLPLLSPLTLEFEIRKAHYHFCLFVFVIGILFQVWHKTCFNCKECKRVLDSVLACDGPDRDVYCKLCYAKKFGPKGYGFGAGGAFLMADSIPYVDDCCQNTVSILKFVFIYFMTWI